MIPFLGFAKDLVEQEARRVENEQSRHPIVAQRVFPSSISTTVLTHCFFSFRIFSINRHFQFFTSFLFSLTIAERAWPDIERLILLVSQSRPSYNPIEALIRLYFTNYDIIREMRWNRKEKYRLRSWHMWLEQTTPAGVL